MSKPVTRSRTKNRASPSATAQGQALSATAARKATQNKVTKRKARPRITAHAAAKAKNVDRAQEAGEEEERDAVSNIAAKLSVQHAQPYGALVTQSQAPVLEDVYKHLIAADARMKPLIERYPCTNFTVEATKDLIDPFIALSGSIISQQVSGAAASSIRRRFIQLFNPGLPSSVDSTQELDYFPSPSTVAICDILFLRSAGLSLRKAEYIQGLAAKFASGELSAPMLRDASYEDLVEKLTAVRGIGSWTVEMFAIFGLKRWDIFSTGDLAIQRGMAAFVGRDTVQLSRKSSKWKYMSLEEMEELSSKFKPYRSVFMWYMWRVVEEVSIKALEV